MSKAIDKGQIDFEDAASEFLECSCGNNVMDSGFTQVEANCENAHFMCNSCNAAACVDFKFRFIANGRPARKVAPNA